MLGTLLSMQQYSSSTGNGKNDDIPSCQEYPSTLKHTSGQTALEGGIAVEGFQDGVAEIRQLLINERRHASPTQPCQCVLENVRDQLYVPAHIHC